MIDSIDPVALLQPEEKEEGDPAGEPSLQQRANEILTAISQRKQQWRQQRQQQRTTDDDHHDNNDSNRRRVETPRRQEERDTTGETRLAIVERGELQLRRRRRRRVVVATTTTVLACLSTVTTSLSHFMFTTLPFVAQQLQVVSDYVSWRQVERLQLVYNYSCQLGDYYRSYYRTTLELYHNMTTTPKQADNKKADDNVIDVETTEAEPSTRLPAPKAPTIAPLGGWKEVKHYLINNLVHSHVYGFNYHEPSRTMGAYYAQFSELLLPAATDSRQRQ